MLAQPCQEEDSRKLWPLYASYKFTSRPFKI